MDFEEFLWALGDTATIPILKNIFESKKPLGQELNRELLRKFRLYMLVGGMPQAILKYLDSKGYQVSSVLPSERKSTISEELSELIASKTVLASYNISDPNVGMSSTYNLENFRLYSTDIDH